MRKFLLSVTAALAIATVFGATAEAATFKPIAKGKSLVMTGELVPGDEVRLIEAYNSSCTKRGFCPERIFLNSMGGNIYEAAAVAYRVNTAGLHTVVGRTDRCVSACVLVFASGTHKVVFPTSRVGVHRVYSVYQNAYGDDSTPVDTDTSILLTMKVAEIYRAAGVPEIVIEKMVATSGHEVTWISGADWPSVEVIP